MQQNVKIIIANEIAIRIAGQNWPALKCMSTCRKAVTKREGKRYEEMPCHGGHRHAVSRFS